MAAQPAHPLADPELCSLGLWVRSSDTSPTAFLLAGGTGQQKVLDPKQKKALCCTTTATGLRMSLSLRRGSSQLEAFANSTIDHQLLAA